MGEQVNNFTIDILNEKENNVFYLLILSRISIKMKQIISCKNFKDVLPVMHFLCTWIYMLSKVLKKSGQCWCKFVIPWKKKLFHAIQKLKAVLGTLQINFWTTIKKIMIFDAESISYSIYHMKYTCNASKVTYRTGIK